MAAIPGQVVTLPVLRPDVEFHPGPAEPDGSPTYVLHDPLHGTFEKLTWVQAEILRRLRVPLTIERLLELVAQRSTVKVTAEDVVRLCADAVGRGLTTSTCIADARAWEAQKSARKATGPADWFRRGIYMRLPLIHPDAFLERTVGRVRRLGSTPALLVYACAAALGLVLLVQQFDAYFATFPYFFNARGAVVFVLTVIAVKSVHEFSHAYVAKALGNRVPTMGIALIFLFPVAYADVTDSWRMRSRRRRMLIALAGIVAELVIAGFALVGWALSTPGLLRSVCFVVSSVTIVSTLVVNLNPALRYDGYYVLSDLLGIDNLQSRAFAVARWIFRRHVLGMRLESPEAGLPPRKHALLVAYAAYAWTYRVFLFGAIALALYHRLAKAVGVVLFFAAIYTLVVKPAIAEVVDIVRTRRLLSLSPRTLVVAALGGAILFWAGWPLPRRVAAPATTVPHASQVIYAPNEGVLSGLNVGSNTAVRSGQTLLVVESEELERQARLAELEMQRLVIELAVIRNDVAVGSRRGQRVQRRALLPQKVEELARAAAQRESVRKAIERSRVVAEFDGTVVAWDESLREGTPVGTEQVLGRIVDYKPPRVVCYVKHDLLAGVKVGQEVCFCSDARSGRLPGRIAFIDPVRSEVLEHRGLASVAGGDIPVVPDARGRLEVLESYYKVEVELTEPARDLRLGQTGKIWLRTPPRSRLADLARYACRVVLRESSF